DFARRMRGVCLTSHTAWVATREPEAPPALTARVCDLLASHPEWERLSRVDAFIEASEGLLRRVLEAGAVRPPGRGRGRGGRPGGAGNRGHGGEPRGVLVTPNAAIPAELA